MDLTVVAFEDGLAGLSPSSATTKVRLRWVPLPAECST